MKPILFNTEMVEAILNGKKTMTRRVIKFSEGITERLPVNGLYGDSAYLFYPRGITYPKYKVGEVLYVRETWQPMETTKKTVGYHFATGHVVWNCDTAGMDIQEPKKWHPSIHMPKEAARIFLKVTNVRVEKLQDIDYLSALNEGVKPQVTEYDGRLDHPEIAKAYAVSCQKACIDAFHGLWDSVYGKTENSWDKNPWVFVYEFERCEKSILRDIKEMEMEEE